MLNRRYILGVLLILLMLALPLASTSPLFHSRVVLSTELSEAVSDEFLDTEKAVEGQKKPTTEYKLSSDIDLPSDVDSSKDSSSYSPQDVDSDQDNSFHPPSGADSTSSSEAEKTAESTQTLGSDLSVMPCLDTSSPDDSLVLSEAEDCDIESVEQKIKENQPSSISTEPLTDQSNQLKDLSASKEEKGVATDNEDLNQRNDFDREWPFELMGGVNIRVAGSHRLTASLDTGVPSLSLTYGFTPVVGLSLLNTVYIFFELPEELKGASVNYSATYSVPLPLTGRVSGTIGDNDIQVDENTVRLQFSTLLTLSLSREWRFTLTITPDSAASGLSLECGETYAFLGGVSNTPILDIQLLPGESQASVNYTLPAADIALVSLDTPIYSNDRIISGGKTAGLAVGIETQGQVFFIPADNEERFEFSLPEGISLEPGTEVKVWQTNGICKGPLITAEVEESKLAFDVVPNVIAFGTKPIAAMEMIIDRSDLNQFIRIKDTRGEGSQFELTAQLASPLSHEDFAYDLPETVFYLKDGTAHLLSVETSILIFSGTTGANPLIKVEWDSENGPQIIVQGGDVYAGSYEASIRWTLTDAP